MSLIDELKGVLARRRNVLEIFGTYKSMYDELLQDLARNYNSDIDTAVSAFYLANYVMDNLQSDEGRLDDDDRVQNVLKNLIKAKEHFTVDFESLVQIYSLIFDWAIRIEKEVVKNVRLLIDPKVIATNVVDVFAIPLFSFLKKLLPELDLRWAMAELDASLRKRFSGPIYDDLITKFPIKLMQAENLFDAGFYVVRNFVENYVKEKYEEGFDQLESMGDIGRRSYNHACSLFYDIISRELYTDIATDDQIVLNDDLLNELKNSLLLNQISSKSDNPYNTLFAKYHIKIKIQGQRTEERFLYIQNFEENKDEFRHDEILGSWNYFLLSEENVNLQSIISYAKQRCIDIRGILNRLKEYKNSTFDEEKTLLSAWMEMFIHNLQEEYNFLELKDSLREQNFIPIGLLKQSKNSSVMNLLLDTVKPISSKRMETLGIKSSIITKEQVIHLLNHVKLITDHASNVVRYLLLQHNPSIEIEVYPLELLYEDKQFPGKQVILLFSTDETNIVGLLCPNEASLEFSSSSLKSRQIISKINQLITDLRIKSLEDARAAKINSFITRGVENILELGQLWLSGSIGKSLDISPDKTSVSDRIDLAMKMEEERLLKLKKVEEERQKALEIERHERLIALRQLYFNEKILNRLVEEITVKRQSTLLNQIKENFPDIYKLENLERTTKIKLKDLENSIEKEETFSSEIREVYQQLLSDISNNIENDTTKLNEYLEKIWTLIVKMNESDLA